jgi:hypothetical protein
MEPVEPPGPREPLEAIEPPEPRKPLELVEPLDTIELVPPPSDPELWPELDPELPHAIAAAAALNTNMHEKALMGGTLLSADGTGSHGICRHAVNGAISSTPSN